MTYDNGAKRSNKDPRFRDIGFSFNKRVADRFSLGAEKYEKDMAPWQKNWKRGDLVFALDVLDHLQKHVLLLNEKIISEMNNEDFGDNLRQMGYTEPEVQEFLNEDHLGACGANLVMLDYFERNKFFQPDQYDFEDQNKIHPEMVKEEPIPEWDGQEPKTNVWTTEEADDFTKWLEENKHYDGPPEPQKPISVIEYPNLNGPVLVDQINGNQPISPAFLDTSQPAPAPPGTKPEGLLNGASNDATSKPIVYVTDPTDERQLPIPFEEEKHSPDSISIKLFNGLKKLTNAIN